MKNLLVCLLLVISSIAAFTQNVGINIDGSPPDPSAILDINSTDRGILVPRMDSTSRQGITTPANGLLVFDTDTETFWYYHSSGWTNLSGSSDHDWLVEQTTNPPTTTYDDIYHMGNVAIGKNFSSYPLDIHGTTNRAINVLSVHDPEVSMTAFGLFLQMNGTGAGNLMGAYHLITGDGTGSHLGTKNDLFGAGTGAQYGSRQDIANSGDGTHYGSYNILSGSGSGSHWGSYNLLQLDGTGSQYGSHQIITNSGSGDHFGSYNRLAGGGSGKQYGAFQEISNSGAATHYGSFDSLSGPGTGAQYGAHHTISNTGSGVHYGTFNALTGTGHGARYGTRQEVTNSGNGANYGSYNLLAGTGTGVRYGTYDEVLSSGSGPGFGAYHTLEGTGTGLQYGSYQNISNIGYQKHYGVYNNLTGTGTGKQYGTYQSIANTGLGDHYGSYNLLLGSGTGVQYGAYQLISNTGAGDHFASYNESMGMGTGKQYGSYQKISNYGAGDHFGSFNEFTGGGTGKHYGTYNLLTSGGNGAHYGTFNNVTGSGSGNHYAGYFNAPGGSNAFAAVFVAGNVVANESGGNYDFRVESVDNTHALFVDASINRVGIGTSFPTSDLEIQGSDNTDAIEFDGGKVRLRHHYDLISTDRDFMRILMDADNDQSNSEFAIFKDVSESTGSTAAVNFHLDGNNSWINGGGNLGIGTTTPGTALSVNGPARASFDASGTDYVEIKHGGFNGIVNTVGDGLLFFQHDGATKMAIKDNGNVGIGNGNPSHPLHMGSGAHVTSGGVWTNASDISKKKDINSLSYGLDEVMQLLPKQYIYKSDNSASIGFIAQDMEKIIPEVVSGERGKKGIAYGLLTATLVSAMQEQQAVIQTQEQKIEAQGQMIATQNLKISTQDQINAKQDQKIADLEEIVQRLANHLEQYAER